MNSSCKTPRALRPHLLTFLVLGLSSCQPSAPPEEPAGAQAAQPAPDSDASDTAAPDPAAQSAKRRLGLSPAGESPRTLTISEGSKVALQLAPESFSASLRVPDIVGNSEGLIKERVHGSDFVASAMNAEETLALVAVRGFIYAEVSVDLVFLIDLQSALATTEGAAHLEPTAVRLIRYDGPSAAADEDTTGLRPFHDVSEVQFAGSQLVISTADASGGISTLTYDESFTPLTCAWRGGESRLCPRGLSPTVLTGPAN